MKASQRLLAVVAVMIVAAFILSSLLSAQSSAHSEGSPQTPQERGYWIDPATGLMWPSRDNGKAVTWHSAMKYCRNLHLAGYTDWRQPTLDELASLVDAPPSTSERAGNAETFSIAIGRHVRGDLTLTGDSWSSNREIDRFGHPYGPGWFFDFASSKPSYDLQLFRNTKYALCVRRAGN